MINLINRPIFEQNLEFLKQQKYESDISYFVSKMEDEVENMSQLKQKVLEQQE